MTRLCQGRTTGRSSFLEAARGLVLAILTFAASCVPLTPAWACDGAFLYEPTTREPDAIQPDMVAGFLYTTWMFLDGRVLVTIRIIRDVSTKEEIEANRHPLFYIVTSTTHTSITYIDPEGYAQCYDIRRYQ